MASTNKTQNLELNQWVRTDPVLMDDFNADNQKIDDAIAAAQSTADAAQAAASSALSTANTAQSTATNAANANPWVKLFDVTVPSAVSSVELNLNSIDLSKYLSLRVYYLCSSKENGIKFRINKLSSPYYANTIVNSSSSPSYYSGDTFFRAKGSVAEIDLCSGPCYFHAGGCLNYYSGAGHSPLKTIDMMSHDRDVILQGSRIVLWGVRAWL